MGNLSKDIQSTIPNEWVKAFLNIKYTANYLNQIDDKFFTQFGISSQQFNVLRILRGPRNRSPYLILRVEWLRKRQI